MDYTLALGYPELDAQAYPHPPECDRFLVGCECPQADRAGENHQATFFERNRMSTKVDPMGLPRTTASTLATVYSIPRRSKIECPGERRGN